MVLTWTKCHVTFATVTPHISHAHIHGTDLVKKVLHADVYLGGVFEAAAVLDASKATKTRIFFRHAADTIA